MRTLSWLACTAALVAVVPLGVMKASGQVGTCEDDTFGFVLEDALDLHVLASNLAESAVSGSILAQLDAGKPCREFLFERVATYEDGDRDYCLRAICRGSTSSAARIASRYEYSHYSGLSPSLPPDACSTTTSNITSGLTAVILPDAVSFEFLLTVLENPPATVVNRLTNEDLIGLWVQHTSTPDTVKLYLKYWNGTAEDVLMVWAYHYGNGQFGPLMVVD